MNIHVRTTARLLKTMFIPAIAGLVIALIFKFLPMQQILLGMVVGLVVFMFYLFYKWTLEQIKQEDQLKQMTKE